MSVRDLNQKHLVQQREPAKETVKKSPLGARTNVKNCPPKIFLKRGSNSIRSDCRTIYAPEHGQK